MSRKIKRKHVQLELLKDSYTLPTENQQIVRVLGGQGNNLHKVEAEDQSVFLVSMPTKFRKSTWVKRGDFLLVEPIEEGDKVKAEIVRILTLDQIKYFQKENVWPKSFIKETKSEEDDLFVNPNRPPSSDSEDDSEEDSEKDSSDSNDSEDEKADCESKQKRQIGIR